MKALGLQIEGVAIINFRGVSPCERNLTSSEERLSIVFFCPFPGQFWLNVTIGIEMEGKTILKHLEGTMLAGLRIILYIYCVFRHDFIGQFSTTLREMNDNRQQGITWEVSHLTSPRTWAYQRKGRFPLRKISIGSDWTFFSLVLSIPPDQKKIAALNIVININY